MTRRKPTPTTTEDIERQAAVTQQAKIDLDHLMYGSHVQGMSLRTIAKAAGVSYETVRRVIADQEDFG